MKSAEDFLKERGMKVPEKSKSYQTENSKSKKCQKSNFEEEQLQKEKQSEACSELHELDKLKTKVLKYVLYKKRTEQEVRQKFSSSQDGNLLDDVIEILKNNGYINDENYIERAVNEFKAINTLSIKEMRNKLYSKGLSSSLIDDYFSNQQEELKEYELACAKKMILKKQTQMDEQDIIQFLRKKGYQTDSIRTAFEEL